MISISSLLLYINEVNLAGILNEVIIGRTDIIFIIVHASLRQLWRRGRLSEWLWPEWIWPEGQGTYWQLPTRVQQRSEPSAL